MKNNFQSVIKTIGFGIKKHTPNMLTGIGIAGMIATTALAVKATPKALRLIEQKKEECDELTKTEIIKTAWKPYIPAVITGVMSITCIIGASSINHRRNVVLTTAYALSESALKEYREKVVETMGEKKDKTIKEAVAKDKMDKKPVKNSEVIITEKGNTLCFDTISGRYFKSDIDKIKKAVNDLNYQMRDEMYISLNEFYYEIGLDGIKMGDDFGWNINEGYIDLMFSSQLANDGTPCLVIDYGYNPRHDYRQLM